jgi:hypothetical protein
MSPGNPWEPLPPPGQLPPGRSNHYLPHPGPQPTSGGRVLLWVLGIFATLTLLLLTICCGVALYGFRIFQNEVSRGITEQVRNSPEIVEHIGEIQQVDLTFSEMSNSEEVGTMVLNVRGTKGSGKLSVNPTLVDGEPEKAYVLILGDGQRIPLTGLREATTDPAANAAEEAEPAPSERAPADLAPGEPAPATEPVNESPSAPPAAIEIAP